jgi:hypothetical protein
LDPQTLYIMGLFKSFQWSGFGERRRLTGTCALECARKEDLLVLGLVSSVYSKRIHKTTTATLSMFSNILTWCTCACTGPLMLDPRRDVSYTKSDATCMHATLPFPTFHGSVFVTLNRHVFVVANNVLRNRKLPGRAVDHRNSGGKMG